MNKAPKVHSPYEEILRKFSEDHEEICRAVDVDIPKERRPPKQFMTGSKYEGSWNVLGMSGPDAIYTFPNGVIFEGDFDDGLRHGLGEMRYPTGEVIKGKFLCGRMVERTLIFDDGLEFNEAEWKYCQIPDRRFTIEYDKGVMPAGNSYMTASQPTRKIPPEYFDTEDGFYNPKTKVVYKPDDISAILRAPTVREQKWIEAKCRYAPEDQIGPRRDLYEEWVEPDTDPEPPLLPSAISRATAWMFESNRSMAAYDSDDSDIAVSHDYSRWLGRKRSSKFTTVEEPLTERPKTGTSETEYLLTSQLDVQTSISNNRLRTQSAIEKPRKQQRKSSAMRKSK